MNNAVATILLLMCAGAYAGVRAWRLSSANRAKHSIATSACFFTALMLLHVALGGGGAYVLKAGGLIATGVSAIYLALAIPTHDARSMCRSLCVVSCGVQLHVAATWPHAWSTLDGLLLTVAATSLAVLVLIDVGKQFIQRVRPLKVLRKS